MNSVLSSVQSLMQMFDGKTQEFINDINNVHMVWLEEIQQEANRMLSRDFNDEPELMPKTPSQKKNSRRKRISLGRQEENQANRRFSKGRRSNLRGSSSKSLNLIPEEIPESSASETKASQAKRPTRKNKQTKPNVDEDGTQPFSHNCNTEDVQNKKPQLVNDEKPDNNSEMEGNLCGSSSKSLNLIPEEIPESSASETKASQAKRPTRKNKQTKPNVDEDGTQPFNHNCNTEDVQNKKPQLVNDEKLDNNSEMESTEVKFDGACIPAQSPPKVPSPEIVVRISSVDRLSAELLEKPEPSPSRSAAKIEIAGSGTSSRQSSVRCSLKLRHSLAGLRHSMTQESVRRASRRSMMKRKASRTGNSTCSSNVADDSPMDSADEEEQQAVLESAVPADKEDNAGAELSKSPTSTQTQERAHLSVGRITRSVAANSPKLAPPSLFTSVVTMSTPQKTIGVADKHRITQSSRRFKGCDAGSEHQGTRVLPSHWSRRSTKRKAPDTVEESPTKRFSPPKKSQSAIRPNMRSFLHTVQKNQMLMMTPNSFGRSSAIKSFIKHTTPLRVDPKTKQRNKLEAIKKKQEQEDERIKKIEEDKRKKQEEMKRKRDERLRRVYEARVKEEQREEEKKKKIEQKMAQIDEKNDKRLAEEKAKKKVALKRQEELEQKKKLEEEAKRKKLQQAEEEKRQHELLAKKKAEEEEQRARRLAEARKALELKKEQERERERELERERQAAAERERAEKEKALALQRELERAAREKERRELEEKRRLHEEKIKREQQQRLAAEEKAAKEREAAAKKAADTRAAAATALNVTVDIESSVMTTPIGKGAGLNVTVDIEKSPQSYSLTPNSGNSLKSTEDYGMDQNSDDSTDDESAPRKPIPSWAEGPNLQQIIMKQYFNPPDLDSFFGPIESPKLENIFYKSKPRYFKRTSSAVWHSPPVGHK
ncbi:inner centromere protein A isoform X2 [Betta splendens]|uniref:Inner centromere protein A isoform X2 n=1 Tax=Betta splendens TaxID=158456 RepID=A0A9W2XW82_BETSP|nr:inner centromere protein A isoform X2 [Betta splendens]